MPPFQSPSITLPEREKVSVYLPLSPKIMEKTLKSSEAMHGSGPCVDVNQESQQQPENFSLDTSSTSLPPSFPPPRKGSERKMGSVFTGDESVS